MTKDQYFGLGMTGGKAPSGGWQLKAYEEGRAAALKMVKPFQSRAQRDSVKRMASQKRLTDRKVLSYAAISAARKSTAKGDRSYF